MPSFKQYLRKYSCKLWNKFPWCGDDDTGGETSPPPLPVPVPTPSPTPGIYRSPSPGFYLHREENGAADFGVSHATVVAKYGNLPGRTIRLFSARMAQQEAPSERRWTELIQTARNEGCVGYAVDMEHKVIGAGPDYCAMVYSIAKRIGLRFWWEPAYDKNLGLYHLTRYWNYSVAQGFAWMQQHCDGIIAWKYDQTAQDSLKFGRLAYANGYTKSVVYLGDFVKRQGIALTPEDIRTLRNERQNVGVFLPDSNGHSTTVAHTRVFNVAESVYA